MIQLNGTVAVVTGAGRGLGAALAYALAEAGCALVLCGRSQSALTDVAEPIVRAFGRRVQTVALDLADAKSVAAAVEGIKAENGRIDILVNNGAMWLEDSDEDHPDDAVLGVVNAAVTGTFLFTQGLLPLFAHSPRPDIVTIGSISGLPNAALQTVSVPFYAAKRAQAALADGLRQKLAGTPVRSIVVHPPYIEDISPLDGAWEAAGSRRKGEAATNRDIAEAVLFALTRPRHVTLSITVDADEGGLYPSPARSA
ncbi:SDR family NAD(P)-dependent oxidoreductase [Ensifer sp. ENS07]|jgi:NADP-dependent 3-hydroxy acid dehydrogenase YdfG|uniref:SDR family NAD(P)-dependent oxidoreductase n=2 Tax=Ensifer TaxID=106591 RepID=A0A9Q8YBZ6_ENSAD|nr:MULTISPECIES: SDR family NAD(P)-dependent oxidoreductase [Ensifer]OWZ95854.1 short-chain dehydrogenase [Sinorhizobium sp. LM21]ANK76340.1 short-chain dehydrogenase [Ensifer adhaerens]KDP76501.1 short-chain dehydrogenase [Ensifer adhaerens]KQZ53918.1 short-chain dehydrogenase [Ensifer sp. Root558]MBD9520363.1 SDR family NAD(P)-dependent oxidoreductase [Ensifer sp. ENS02]